MLNICYSLQRYTHSKGHPRVRQGRPTNAHIIRILSDLSEIDEDIVRGEDGDGAGDDVEHGLYLETRIMIRLAVSRCLISPDKFESTHPSCQ